MDLGALKTRVGENLKRARWRAGLTHERVKACTQRYYQDLENGKRNPTLEVLALLADEFHVTVADLVNVPGGRPADVPLDKLPAEAPKKGRKPKAHRSR